MSASTGYTKLFSSLIGSTIWREDNDTRIVWITLLAMADRHGVVEASVPGLADFARIPVGATRAALSKLMSPDPDSRTKDHDGRRIEDVDGGWRLLNHAKYRAKLSEIERREYKRQRQAEYRAVETVCGHGVDNVDICGQRGQIVDSCDTSRSRSRVQKQERESSTLTLATALKAPTLTVEDAFGPSDTPSSSEAGHIAAVMAAWTEEYAACRNGAQFRPHPIRDYQVFAELAETYDDVAHLREMFRFFFLADDLPDWAVTRSPKCFLRLAPETDAAVQRTA